ncbi:MULTISPECIES: pyridoxamine 5'-phosphate oxidase family protein [unclassified Micromonospora]|uniref:pyridoxamine 5'-phosphate oxidase family protein n=1 Tax=Micromonospora TaxID=1873 RepID=UPI002417A60E|nr:MULTISPECIES: pyridoxamine 5'-phosphate oxidase family protein [unclassified Micromonospora]MDG4816359.1 pyridoxamine 5'-phosphate oxidase family protein [Micromonospora sp. WMMD956]WFE58885.1 pyridoxamine 5'-phosphate oxidase family protein [Micromonospora sp. WMMD712]
MASWSEFAADEPRLADGIRHLMQQYGPGFGYLATVRADGGPRVHPVSPVITDEGLFCFVVDSPKRRDLERDGRYALHSFPPEDSDDEAYVAGHARPVTDQARVARLAEIGRAAPQVDWRLFEFTVDVAMLARRGDVGAVRPGEATDRPAVQVWLDPGAAGAASAGTTTTTDAASAAPGGGAVGVPDRRSALDGRGAHRAAA